MGGRLRRTCRGAVVPAIPIADGLHEGEVFSASFAQRAWQASLSSHDMPWAVVPAVPDSSNRLVTWNKFT